ncbi:TVP38/TMEM64 family protein [Halobacillus halophilus]|uniref:TVP38/TMEM64 family membrane protein n=1 Tax=Halobacillus halophilus (strain ATCC 35676 / DSM 2266 / JCM 20832 / KCTC 3685 / LMG 17431 / NBRC 102448 / NCIMB 2269) TaxID=866895 RepID=I0JHW4_HALH3|nr:TVP38/TMEM64 family protein [Halobacillus halophilus]ASF37935.1 TVP38/TMEM64 family protein [Halobacillus halophilus]CCG43732.1 DedA family protein [Halobacillus halophilus DSM 2266]
MKWKSLTRALLFVIAFLVIAWFIRQQFDVTADSIRSFILSFGFYGPLLFMGLYAIGPIVVFPTSILSLAAAFAYGLWPGMLYIVIGATAAGITGYVMGRFFGDSVLKFQESKWSEKIYYRMKERGFLYVFVLRLIPIVGFDILSYLAGVTRVKLRPFIIATIFGMLPGTFAYSLVGTSLASGDRQLIFIALTVFALIFALTFLFRNKVRSWLKI